ncbi:MAG: tyrosine-type recombinase/integrase [Lachnospiraceae bacterium]|nr:tyrosine-type recombinase/integrase [Lachnospiraceae bacterium]
MNELQTHISDYLNYCRAQKRLDEKTLKAYRIDLRQFTEHFPDVTVSELTSSDLENHISTLHRRYKPKTVKRKIASAKAFFHYLEYREIIDMNPFNKIQIRFREPALLPKTIPLYTVEAFLSVIYQQQQNASTAYQRRNALRDAAAIELLFATGMRISELCSLKECDVDLYDATVLIYGKGRKERRIQIGSEDVVRILTTYKKDFREEIQLCQHFFANQSGKAFSDQAVRRMICKYSSLASIEMHITPHMFRHTFATCLLEADVDIRFIQEMLGHSSINVTEIYTHVAVGKQRDILRTKHPRMGLRV